LTRLLLKNNDILSALAAAKNAIIFNPDNASIYSLLADIYRRLNMPNDAIDALKRSAQLMPYDPDIHYRLGILYKKQRLYQDAVSEWKKCLKIQPDNKKCRTILENR
jgi:tetratricopeptide (TPR) repeat protein